MKKLLLLPALAMFACIDVGKETGEITETGETETETPAPSATAGVSWGEASVTLDLAVENGLDGADYYWGIAENTGDCVANDWCWTGEDCFAGYELESGDVLSYCHPISETGGDLSYGADTASVAEGLDTVFTSADFSSLTTHIVDDRGSAEGPCWVWGADTSYYSGYEKTCTEM